MGNERRVMVSGQGGKSNLLAALKRLDIDVPRDDPRLDHLLREVKQRESQGYAYEGAEASFALLARRHLGRVPNFFTVESFRVMVEHRHNALGELVTVSEAVVKVDVDGERFLSVGEGNGPVNALDTALRKDLGRYSHLIADLELVDYKVRILNGGTGPRRGCSIESRDGAGDRWFTVGRVAQHRRRLISGAFGLDHWKLLKEGATTSAGRGVERMAAALDLRGRWASLTAQCPPSFLSRLTPAQQGVFYLGLAHLIGAGWHITSSSSSTSPPGSWRCTGRFGRCRSPG